ncbi:MAG: YggS family pyridoxal phosphate-dependent enzyme [Pirellulaceae bacterium]
MNEQIENTLLQNLRRVRGRIADAATQSGRSELDVTLVGVTKYVDAEMAALLAQVGCLDLGESRPQELWSKATAIEDTNIVWHQVGHLQTNKVTRTLEYAAVIHSVDSLRLAEAIDQAAGDKKLKTKILLEVNVSGESAKQGFDADELRNNIVEINELPNINLVGLMCMAGLGLDEQQTRGQFSMLRELRDELAARLDEPSAFCELSMGMSGDFEWAIAEGATIVRIGSILYEGLL